MAMNMAMTWLFTFLKLDYQMTLSNVNDISAASGSIFNRLRRVPPATMERAILQAASSPCRSPARTWLEQE